MKNIYLVGFMGTGKTETGKRLAQLLAREFVEMDSRIEATAGATIGELFATKGEAHFRRLENALLEQLAGQTDLVVSCGGGIVCDETNLKLLRGSGITVCLTAQAETIYERIKHASHRPLLRIDNPLERIKTLLAERQRFYAQAHHHVATDSHSPAQIAEKIVALVANE